MSTSGFPENTSLKIGHYDKEGRLYLYQSAKTPKSPQNSSKTYDYNILIVAPGESAYTAAKIKLDGYSMHRFKYKWTEDKLFIAGTYKEEDSKNKMVGLFLKSYTLPDMKPDKELLMPLTTKTKGYGVAFRDMTDKGQAPYGKKLSSFNISAIAEAEDGSIYLSGNNLQKKLITESSQKMLRKEYKSIETEMTSNLITARIDSSGKPKWIKSIPMSSSFSDPFYRHSVAKGFTYENNFYLVFNDHSKSQNKYDKAPTMGMLSALTSNRLVRITPAGEMSDHSIYGNPGLSTFFYASGSYFDSTNGCLYTYLERGSQKFQCYITEF